MNTEQKQKLNSIVELKLNELLPEIEKLLEEYGELEPFEVNFKVDPAEMRSSDYESANVEVESRANAAVMFCNYYTSCKCIRCN